MSENSSEAMQLRRRLAELATLVTPDTLLHGIESLSLRNMMAASAADLGDHARAQSWKLWWFAWRKRMGVGAIGGFRVPYPFEAQLARSTIAAILERHGIEPAPERNRKTTWKEFLARHW